MSFKNILSMPDFLEEAKTTSSVPTTKGFCEIHYDFFDERNADVPEENKKLLTTRTLKMIKNKVYHSNVFLSSWFGISLDDGNSYSSIPLEIQDDEGKVYRKFYVMFHTNDTLNMWGTDFIFVDNNGKKGKGYADIDKLCDLYLCYEGKKCIKIYDKALDKGSLPMRYTQYNDSAKDESAFTREWTEHGHSSDSGTLVVNPDKTFELVTDEDKNINKRDLTIQKFREAYQKLDEMEGIYPESSVLGYNSKILQQRNLSGEHYYTIKRMEEITEEINSGKVELNMEPASEKQMNYIRTLCEENKLDGNRVPDLTKHQAMHFIEVLKTNLDAIYANEFLPEKEIKDTYEFYCNSK